MPIDPQLAEDVLEIIRVHFPMFRHAVTRDLVVRHLPAIVESLRHRGWEVVRR